MNIRDYIYNAEKSHKYRIKTAFEMTDEVLDRIERVICAYDPINMSVAKKTIFQSKPLDFYNVPGAEIWFVDVELCIPVGAEILRTRLFQELKCADKFVVVRCESDPIEYEIAKTNAYNEIDAEAEKENLTPEARLADPNFNEMPPDDGQEKVGEKRLKNFLDVITDIRAEQREKMKVDAPSPLFKWMDMPEQEKHKNHKAEDEKEKTEFRKVFKDSKNKLKVIKKDEK